MKQLFVSDKLSIQLKELGFDEPCFAYYTLSHINEEYRFKIVGERSNGNNDWYINYVGEGLANSELIRNPSGRLSKCMTAPLYQQVIDWLFEEHHIWISTEYYNHCEPTDQLPVGFAFYIEVYGHTEVGRDLKNCFKTQYEAYDKAIEQALKLIESC